MRNLAQYLFHPTRLFVRLDQKGLYRLKDKTYLKWLFRWKTGYKLNLDDPKTFNEKIQFLKLFRCKKEFSNFVDKIKVKDLIKEILGEVYLIKTLGTYSDFDQINFNALPNSFVLKTTHDSGGVIIVKDKSVLDIEKAKKKINDSLASNYYWLGRELPYKSISPRIICEEFIQDHNQELNDYKVFVFNGKAQFIQVDYNRFTDHHRSFFNREWEYVPFTTMYPTNPSKFIEKPSCIEELLTSAEKISEAAGIPPFLRVDFYVVDLALKFGEVTFYHGSGLESFDPFEYDYVLGDLIVL